MSTVYGGQLDEDIRVIIDGKTVFCPRNSSWPSPSRRTVALLLRTEE